MIKIYEKEQFFDCVLEFNKTSYSLDQN